MVRIRSLLWTLVLLCFCIGVFAQDAEQTQSQSLSLSPSPPRITAEPVETTTRNAPSRTQDEDAEETEKAQKPGLSATETTTSRTPPTQSSDRSSSTIFSSIVRSSVAPSSTSSIAPVPSPTIRTTEDWYKPEEEKLPLQPVLTPAFGFAGALLIISGLIIGFVGIQHRLIYIFLSCVYLVSLSITVLIIYVVNPPVSDAVQGGYLVGIVVPGFMLGAGAMVFSNLTEGFGCLLGGFCLAMWLLCLKAGGLLQDPTGVVIFICCFCAVVWGTAYVRWFQPYTLIFSLSFSGATAVILGIDCFSRAGLKEFWIYIWRLNDKIFPYGTATYPMTRGIKVEVAGIVAFTVLGMLSQMKLWGFIKKKNKLRQDRKDAERRGLEREEEIVGQRVNWEISRARERWEEVYEQSQTKMSANGEIIEVKSLGSDSGIGDMSAKGSTTTNTRKWIPQITVQATEIEMNHMPKFISPISSRPSSPDRHWRCGPDSDPVLSPSDEQRKDRKSKDLDALAALEGAATRSSGRNEKRDSKPKRVSGSPDTPFPTLDAASPATRTSKRLSTGSRKLLNRLSHISTGEMSKSQERLTGYDDEAWDDSSSVAATIDELDSDNDLDGLRSLPSGTPRVSMVLDKAINTSDPDPASGWKEGAGGSGEEAEMQIREPVGPWRSLTSDVLPHAPLNRVVSGFRTHEWTKRLEVAEEPTVAPLPVTPIVAAFPVSASSPSHSSRNSGCESLASHTIPEDVAVDHETPSTPTRQSSTVNAALPPLESVPTEVEEASAPVHLEALAQTTLNGEVAPAPARPRSSHAHMSLRPKSREHRTSHNPYRTSTGPSRQGSRSRPSSSQGQGITRSSSYGSLALPNTQFRTSSNPLQPLSEHDDDNMSLRERQTFLRQSSMPIGSPPAHLAPAPSPYRMSSQQLPQHLAHQQQGLERRLSAQQLSAQPQFSRRASREPHSMETLNRGVMRPGMTDLEIMEVRRKELLEERKKAQMVREEEERRRVIMEGQWSNRYRESVRMSGAGGIGDDVHREGLRRMMSDAAIGNGGRRQLKDE